MKKFTFTAFALFTFIASAQTFVSTTPENKNVILEEFTGISCGYCPDGHLIAEGIHNNNPNDFAVIAIHAGGFANPQGAGTDFRTTFGTAIDSYWGISGYPSGTVNRPASGDVGRSAWAGATNTLLSQLSPVNVGVQATVDMATNVLTVDVEVYYTGSQTVTSNQLNIAVVQNNVEGPQSSGSTNPSQMLPNGNYNHQHMLRHMMTGTWGEQITNISTGALFSNQYTWTMPANINGVNLDPTNLGIIAFVSEDNEEILSGTIEVAPSIVFVNSYDAYCMSSSASNAICATTTDIEVTFRNYGNQNLTSLDINYSINGGSGGTYPWTGNLAPAGTETITIPGVSFAPQGTNNISVSTSNPNGNTDQNTSNDNTSASFAQYSATGQVQGGFVGGNVTIEVTTDQYGNETSWELIDDNGTILASAAAGSMSNSSPQAPVNIPVNANECYSFVIYDAYGDGICCAYGNGSYSVTDAGGTTIASGGSFLSEEGTHFETNGSTIPASWDCAGLGDCTDPGTGNGAYSSYTQCMAACTSTSVENEDRKDISIYPNPVKGTLNIKGIFESVNIYDMFGRLVLTSTNDRINTSDLADGVYVVNINTNNIIVTKRITVAK